MIHNNFLVCSFQCQLHPPISWSYWLFGDCSQVYVKCRIDVDPLFLDVIGQDHRADIKIARVSVPKLMDKWRNYVLTMCSSICPISGASSLRQVRRIVVQKNQTGADRKEAQQWWNCSGYGTSHFAITFSTSLQKLSMVVGCEWLLDARKWWSIALQR